MIDEFNYIDKIARAIRAETPSTAIPEEDTDPLFRIYAVLLLALGERVTAEDVHNAWSAWMVGRDPEHESIVPFTQLAADVAEQDSAYVRAIHRVARKRMGRGQK